MWTENDILELVENKPGALERAIIHLYNCQTPAEKAAGATVEENGAGFSGADARMGTYMAKWALAGKRFTGKYRNRALRMAKKYRKQLVARANQVKPEGPKTKAAGATRNNTLSESIARETQAEFNAEALKAKIAPLPKKREPFQPDLRFANIELD